MVGTRLLRWLGVQRVTRASAACMGLGAALLAVAFSPRLAQAGALLLGLGGAGLVLVSPALLTGPDLQRRLTLVNAAASAAGVAAPLLLSFVDAASGHGRLAMLVPLPALAWLSSVRIRGESGPAASPATGPRAGVRPAAGEVALAALRIVLVVSAEFAFVVWGAARLQDSGLAPAGAAAASVAFQLGMASGRLAGPRLAERLPLARLGAALAMLSSLAIASPAGPALITVALGLAGLGLAPLYPHTLTRLVATPGLSIARGAAIGSACSGAAVLWAPISLNALAGHLTLRPSFLAAIPLLALFLLLDRRRATPATASSPAEPPPLRRAG